MKTLLIVYHSMTGGSLQMARAADASNCSNRSPYPTLHLLRESSIDRAVAACPEAEAIFETNIATLRGMDDASLKALFGSRVGKPRKAP